MTRGETGLADEFLTPSGLEGYRAAMALASSEVGAALTGKRAPGRVDGYRELKQTVDALEVDVERGIGLPAALNEVINLMAANSAMVADPAYLAHLHCPPTVSSLASEVVISAFNQSMDSFDQAPAATAVEQRVVEYVCATIGYETHAGGTFTSGGTQSNLQALLIARDLFAARTLGWNVDAQGLPPEAASWRVLCSAQAHFSVRQALRILGLGGAVVEVETDAAGRMRMDALARRVSDAGTPIMALVLTAGTTDYGAIDPLPEAIAIARRHGIWTHVDACAGGCLAFSNRHRHLVRGIELADSVAIDFHKLLFQAISCSALLVRHRDSLDTSSDHADYLNPRQDSDEDVLNLVGGSLQTTRRFDALKVFVAIRALGREAIAEMIDATCAAAAAAAVAVLQHQHLELVAPVATSTVVLRWHHRDLSDEDCDAVNRAIRSALAHSGRAIVGRSRAAGRQTIKLTFVNPVATAAQAAEVVAQIAEDGERILLERGRGGEPCDRYTPKNTDSARAPRSTVPSNECGTE